MKVALLIVLISTQLMAQRYQPRYASFVLSAVSGASWGIHETSVHHPNRFPESWNKQFWDNSLSWRNKYQDGNPTMGPKYWGSTSFLAWTTDAKHLFGTVHRGTLFAAGLTITIGENKNGNGGIMPPTLVFRILHIPVAFMPHIPWHSDNGVIYCDMEKE